jgi:glycosyltransferase involved in cell wall biosynthesis
MPSRPLDAPAEHHEPAVHRVGMGLLFWPRGGSAQVAGYLARALDAHGWPVTLASGSLGPLGAHGNADTFFTDIDDTAFRYDDAQASYAAGGDPMDSPQPMHPSYEDKPGVSDRSFTEVSPAQFAHASDAWSAHLAASPAFLTADVLHLHHLSVLQRAARLVLPGVPMVSHLHGTDLKLLDAIDAGTYDDGAHPYAPGAAALLRDAAKTANATFVVSAHELQQATRLLDLDPATVHVVPNGVDVDRFAPRAMSVGERRAHWHRWLVSDPQGWTAASGEAGSITYGPEALDRFIDPLTGMPNPVLMFVGRFLGFKRVPLLVRAYARAAPRFRRPAPLVIWGGATGEWEGEHPYDVAAELGVRDVFFTGWRDHDDLATALNCADALVAPSVDEPFGQVYLEAMASGLPVVGTTTGGPLEFVNVEEGAPDGWLVAPDDIDALAEALVTVVNGTHERVRRGVNARRHAVEGYSWSALSGRFVEVYQGLLDHR